MITLGKEVKDTVTGFKGIATGRCVYFYKCVRILIEPPAVKNERKDGEWFDEDGVVETGKGITVKLKKPAKSTGGPRRNEPHVSDPI